MTDWVFQANPDRYDLLAAVSRGTDDSWAMNTSRSVVTVGERIFFYVSGREAGVYATGRVTSLPVERTEDDPAFQYGKWGIRTSYELEIVPPILREELLGDPLLSQEAIFTGWQGTNYRLGAEAALRLEEISDSRGFIVESQTDHGYALDAQDSADPFTDPIPASDDPDERVFQSIRLRRGQRHFRRNLLQVYGGRCAISGHGPIDVLEAAHSEPHSKSGRNNIDNGLLLRADLHTLLDARLLWIDPATMTVRVKDVLADSPYGQFDMQPLRPRMDGSYPNPRILRRRVP